MKSARNQLNILSAYRELGSYRAAAALCGTTHRTVRQVVERQGQPPVERPPRVDQRWRRAGHLLVEFRQQLHRGDTHAHPAPTPAATPTPTPTPTPDTGATPTPTPTPTPDTTTVTSSKGPRPTPPATSTLGVPSDASDTFPWLTIMLPGLLAGALVAARFRMRRRA